MKKQNKVAKAKAHRTTTKARRVAPRAAKAPRAMKSPRAVLAHTYSKAQKARIASGASTLRDRIALKVAVA